MKKLLYISILALLFSSNAIAQKTTTATMRISATIVSGVTLNHVEVINVDFNKESRTRSDVEFTTPEHLDTDVKVSESVVLENEFGDQVELTSESEHSTNKGKHKITLTSMVDPSVKDNVSGYYRGNLTTTINYL